MTIGFVVSATPSLLDKQMWEKKCWSLFTFHTLWWRGNKSTQTHLSLLYNENEMRVDDILYHCLKMFTYASALRLFENFYQSIDLCKTVSEYPKLTMKPWFRFPKCVMTCSPWDTYCLLREDPRKKNACSNGILPNCGYPSPDTVSYTLFTQLRVWWNFPCAGLLVSSSDCHLNLFLIQSSSKNENKNWDANAV